jgi:kynurenine 3-monooxygenase
VLSVLLARRGFAVSVYEKRPDMRREDIDAGRSINLVLTRRGLRALELLGLREAVLNLTVPVLGRMMHSLAGELTYQPYGKDDSECNYSVSRGKLNEYLLDAAEAAGCKIHFEHELVDADFDEDWCRFTHHEGMIEVSADVVFGCDGAFSGVRKALVENHGAKDSIGWLQHGYKELEFPVGADGGFPMDGHALHIWPRGVHMLMGLANLDNSFTGTIYLRNHGDESFEALDSAEQVQALFERHYPDAIALLEDDFAQEFVESPVGHLGTVRCAPWHHQGKVLLVGDSAHGVVPFFGQGLNCGFEDCAVFWELSEDVDDLARLFDEYYELRKTNTDAIADMAEENFIEMSERVGDKRFLLKKAIERRIEQSYPELYRSRYATVMYSYNPYRLAFDAGLIQSGILSELAEGIESADEVDMLYARALITERLTPFYAAHNVDLSF